MIVRGSPGVTFTINVFTVPPVAAGAVCVTVKLYVPANVSGSRSKTNDPSFATESYVATVPSSGLSPISMRSASAARGDAATHSTVTS